MDRVINNRYFLHDQIGEGGMGAVFRATDRLTGKIVALKRVMLTDEFPSGDLSASHEHQEKRRTEIASEFKILAGLRHPNIISVLDYGFDAAHQPFYTMTLLRESQTILEAGAGLDLEGKINLMEQLLQGLIYLHRRGVLHRDIKPKNVLVTDDIVRLLDFGLSHKTDEEGETGGSPLYMAPELLREDEPTVASDIYAVGTLLYQLLSETHPFGVFNSGFYQHLLNQKPDWTAIDHRFHPILKSLLAKEPENRPESAQAVIRSIAASLGRPLPPETMTIRESYLQSARFVGREKEMSQLITALKTAKDGQGSAWLIDGESGVGKSRLIREIETLALVQGFQLMRGQGVEEGGGQPFNLWQEPVRYLLATKPETSDLAAGVLSSLIPDIQELLERKVKPAPELDDKASKTRLLTTIAQLFLEDERPLLLVLEDLHWASESLAVIPYLTRLIGEHRMMIIGSSRSDETPPMAEALSNMNHIRLSRLNGAEIARLATAILGEVEQQDEIVAFLQRETEGNTFFAVEIMRALAEEAGRLDQIGQMELPEGLLPKGIQGLVRRRIDKLPSPSKTLLVKAAIAGRELDIPLIERLGRKLQIGIETTWLSQCTDVAILEVQNGIWQFSHGKIREALLTELAPNKERLIHAEIAHEIELLQPDDQAQAGRLAYHWRKAENIDKEITYSHSAGKQAAAQFAHQDAVYYFDRLLELTPAFDLETRYELHIGRLEAYIQLGNAEEQQQALSNLTQLAKKLGDPAKRLEILNREGIIFLIAGEVDKATAVFSQMVEVAQDNQLAEDKIRGLIGLAESAGARREIVEGMKHIELAKPLIFQVNDPKLEIRWLNVIALMKYYAGDVRQAIHYLEDMLRLIQAKDLRRYEKTAIGNLGIFHEVLGEYEKAQTYNQKTLELSRQIGDANAEALTQSNLGALHVKLGNLEKALDTLEEALRLNRQAGNAGGIAHVLTSMGHAYHKRGNYDQAKDYLNKGISHKQQLNMLWSEANSWNIMGHLMVDCKKYEDALEAFLTAERLQADFSATSSQIETQAGLAIAYLRLQSPAKALNYAERVWDHLQTKGLSEEWDWDWAISALYIFRAFNSQNDSRGVECIRLAYKELKRRAKSIATETNRKKYLTQVAAHREITFLYKVLIEAALESDEHE